MFPLQSLDPEDDFTYPVDLLAFAVDPLVYLETFPEFPHRLQATAVVVHQSPGDDGPVNKVLVLQRSSMDPALAEDLDDSDSIDPFTERPAPRHFPGTAYSAPTPVAPRHPHTMRWAAPDPSSSRWETPRIHVNFITERYSVLLWVRWVLEEEFGLALTHVVDLLDERLEWDEDGAGSCREVAFLVLVVDLDHWQEQGVNSWEESFAGEMPVIGLNRWRFRYVDYVWASREDIESEHCRGRQLVWASEKDKEIALRGLDRAALLSELLGQRS